MAPLRSLVTGASRGIGRGCAVALGGSGAGVVVTGRTMGALRQPDGLEETARLVDQAGGHGIALRCDHSNDEDVAAVFAAVESAFDGLDVLVNNATAVGDVSALFSDTAFWDLEPHVWDDLFAVGLRSHFIAARLAVPLMLRSGGGLIVNISSAGAAARIGAVLPYGVAKAALDRMTADMAAELEPLDVTVVSLWPPPTATPGMLAAAEASGEDPSYMSHPLFTGSVLAALAADPHRSRWTGQALRVGDLATTYGIAPMPYR